MTDRYAIDSHKLHFHPIRVAQTLLSQNDWNSAKNVYLIYLEAGLAGQCNARCTFCAVDYLGYKKDYIDLDMFTTRLNEMGKLGVKAIMYAGEGEPMLHPQVNAIVKATKAAGIDVSFTTNGTLMNTRFVEESLQHCDWVKVSLNAGSPETYAKVHRVKAKEFDKVIENIKYAVAYKKEHNLKCAIGLQCVLLPENAHEMESLAGMCRELELDYFVVKPYSQHLSSNTHQYEGTSYKDYTGLGEALAQYNTETFQVIFRDETMKKLDEATPYETCISTPNLWAYIDAKMNVVACSAYLGNDRFNLGNLNDSDFKTIWQGSKRQALFEEGICIDECRKNCRMNHANIYLDQIANDKVPHVNFI